MAAPRRRKRNLLLWLGVPIALTALLFALVANDPVAAGGVGAIVGLFIGVAMLAFPDLDRGGPADTEDGMFH